MQGKCIKTKADVCCGGKYINQRLHKMLSQLPKNVNPCHCTDNLDLNLVQISRRTIKSCGTYFTCALGNPGHNGNLKESSMTIFQEGNCKTFFQQKKI